MTDPGRGPGITIALGYTGDAVINSVSDILMMVLGFWLASPCRSG